MIKDSGEMSDEQVTNILDKHGNALDAELPSDGQFALVCWNPATRAIHVWTPNTIQQDKMVEFLEEAVRAVRTPERVLGGN